MRLGEFEEYQNNFNFYYLRFINHMLLSTSQHQNNEVKQTKYYQAICKFDQLIMMCGHAPQCERKRNQICKQNHGVGKIKRTYSMMPTPGIQ